MTELVFLHLLAGNGGHGRISFRREKYVAKGGPDGGDGGNGGNITIRGDKTLNTLREYAGRTQFAAGQGGAGSKRKMTGAKGEDITLEVPVGTTIWQITENRTAHQRRLKLGGIEQTLKRDQIRKERYEIF
ncbi:MAG: GTPase, partial [Patescibacteria group bacterium]|nr:GTPase [Patescibacteria group bacterium]